MDDIIGGIAKFAGIVLLVIVIIPFILSSLIINWVGNITDSAFVFILLHLVIGFVLFVIGGLTGEFWSILIIAGTGLFFTIIAGIMMYEALGDGFNYEKHYESYSNWNMPIIREE